MMRDQAEDALARSARGDPVAFEEIVRQHQAMVFSIAYHFLGDAPDAEEVAQDVFLKLHRNLPAIKSAAHLTAWLRKVTTHRSIDQARRRGPSPPLSLDDVPEPAAEAPLPELAVKERLQRLVAALPERWRLVVILRYQEELELREIAEILEIPINTVKSSLQRSLALLREKLTRCFGDVPV